MGYVFTLEAKRKLCIIENKKDVTEKVYNIETTDYLFSQMNNYILSSIKNLDKSSVQNLFTSGPSINKIGNDVYYIVYRTDLYKFLIYQPYGQNKIKIDFYDYDFQANKIRFIYSYTQYK